MALEQMIPIYLAFPLTKLEPPAHCKRKLLSSSCRGSMDLWESIPQLYQSHYALEEEASWLQTDVIPLECLGELWSECNGDKRSGLDQILK
jgi:hypothetical protein